EALQRFTGSIASDYPVDKWCQAELEQSAASVECLNDSDSACNPNGCGTLQAISASAANKLTVGIAPVAGASQCPKPGATSYTNWTLATVSGVSTCVIDKDQTCAATTGDDHAGSTFACVGQTNPSDPKDDCGPPTELYQPDPAGPIHGPGTGTYR